MGKQADALIEKFGDDYTYDQLRQIKKDFGLSKIQYEYPGPVKRNTFTELEELAKDGDADAKKAIKLLLQTKRLNEK
ncbi:hypothetical protein [Microcoleus sp. D2_18a_B4]|uniref:hypothetical protein n=1 Tax=Microcoleus sp. D2_18a_B4 TaxID=3055329 RepID=UPI002FD12D28